MEVGEVPHVLADNGLDAGETRWFMSRYCPAFRTTAESIATTAAGKSGCRRANSKATLPPML
jgi:hypothetical protein